MEKWNPEDIKKLRKALELSQTKFGDLLGVTRNYISYIERGEREPSKTLKLLFGCVKKDLNEKENGKEVRKGYAKKRNIQEK